MQIKTDHKWKNFLDWYQLTDKEKADFDYMSREEALCASFIRYRGVVYSMGGFMVLDAQSPFPGKWHSYQSDSFYSGVLIELSDDGEQYRIGTYIS